MSANVILFDSKVGVLDRKDSYQFLRMTAELGIAPVDDHLRWVAEGFPYLFRGKTPDGETFVSLWEQQRQRDVAPEEWSPSAPPSVDGERKVIKLGCIAPTDGNRRQSGNRRKSQGWYNGVERRLADRRQP